MQAFHNDIAVKNKYLERIRAHAASDEIIKGTYWEDGKGCAVGCTIHSNNHGAYESELGIPEWLARVEDVIFEGLPNERAKEWPEQFLSAVKPGVDLNKIKTPFITIILESCLKSMDSAVFDKEKNPEVVRAIAGSKAAVEEMIRCHREGLDLSAAESAAWSARSAAESAAESAAWSAAWSARSAAWSARSAAWSAAESAAWSARSAAESAAWSAAESAAWSAAESAAFEYFADELLKLLRAYESGSL